jgi:clan AA aspartic protease
MKAMSGKELARLLERNGWNVGLTYIQASIANPARPRRRARLKFLVDSGAAYSVVPASVLTRLGIKPTRSKSFILADGSEVKRRLGEAMFRLNGEQGTSPVIFGEEGDSILLGSVSLEVLGLLLDPFKRELRSLPMMLASQRLAK